MTSPLARTAGGCSRACGASGSGSDARLRVVATDEPVTPRRAGFARSQPGRSSPSSRSSPPAAGRFQLVRIAVVSLGHRRRARPRRRRLWRERRARRIRRPRGRAASARAITSWTDELAERHVAVHRHVEPVGGRAPVRRRRRQELDARPRRRAQGARRAGHRVGRGGAAPRSTRSRRRSRPRPRRSRRPSEGVSGITEIPSALTAITASLSAMASAFSSTLQTIEDADAEGELQTALEDSPECADITS